MLRKCFLVHIEINNFFKYSGDLNNIHPNNGNNWITETYLLNNGIFLSGIQLFGTQMVVWYSNVNIRVNLVRYSNGIGIPDHSVIGQVSTIQIPESPPIENGSFWNLTSKSPDFKCFWILNGKISDPHWPTVVLKNLLTGPTTFLK